MAPADVVDELASMSAMTKSSAGGASMGTEREQNGCGRGGEEVEGVAEEEVEGRKRARTASQGERERSDERWWRRGQ